MHIFIRKTRIPYMKRTCIDVSAKKLLHTQNHTHISNQCTLIKIKAFIEF